MASAAISPRDRYLAAFAHQETDRVPIHLNMQFEHYLNDRIRWENQFEQAEVFQQLGCDPIVEIWLPDPTPHPDVKVKTWREYRPGEKEPYITKEYHTPAGVLRQVVRETEDWTSSLHQYWVRRTLGPSAKVTYGMDLFDDWNISRRTEPWVKGPEDLEKLRYLLQLPNGFRLEEWRMDAVRAKEFAERNGLLTMARRTIVVDAFQWFCNIVWFMMQLHDDPAFVEEFFAIFREFALKQEEIILDIGVDVVQYRGWYETPDFWGGKNYERYVAPVIREQAKAAHEADTLFCYLLTKGHREYLDAFEGLDVDIHYGVDPIMGGVNLKEMKQRLGPRTTIAGGVNSEVTLTRGTRKEVARATQEAIEACAPGGGFILAPVAGVWRGIPWENVETMIQTAHGAR